MVKVDATTLQEGLHFAIVTAAAIDGVLAAVVPKRRARHYKLRAGENFEVIGSRLHSN